MRFSLAHAPVDLEESPRFAVARDGQSFVMIEPIPGVVVAQNWLIAAE